MAQHREKAQIHLIPTGIPNLDLVLGGGIPAYSVNLVAGPPGSGKTTYRVTLVAPAARREQGTQ